MPIVPPLHLLSWCSSVNDLFSVNLDDPDASGLRIAGVDEVGRGPLAGDVVTAAVILDPARPIQGLRDSKKLSETRRQQLAVGNSPPAVGGADHGACAGLVRGAGVGGGNR
jgi:hypothetical protein